MGGFLGALGMLAPIGETLGGIRNLTVGQQTQQDAQTKLMQDLVGSNPEYQPLLDYVQAGGKDVLPMLGGNVGQNIQAAFKQQKFQQLMAESQDKGWSPTDFLNQAAAAGVISDPDEYFKALTQLQTPKVTTQSLQSEVADFLKNPPPRMPPDQLARLQGMDLNNPSELLEAHKMIASYGAATPQKNLHFVESVETDPTSGYQITWQRAYDPLTNTEVGNPEAMGVKLSGQQAEGLSQAHQLLQSIPEAEQDANSLQKHMNDLVKNGTIAPGGERTWILNQYRRYVADRTAAHEDPWNPASWGYYTQLPTTDPVYAQYATIMGQAQAQMAAPMHIFRSQGLFTQIAPHIPAPENLPQDNINSLRMANKRFSQDTNYLEGLEKGLGLPGYGESWPTRGATPPAATSPAGGGGSDPVGAAIAAKMRSKYSTASAGGP